MVSDDYADQKVVWILGSGFSKSLGGPLLPDLFKRRDELQARGLMDENLQRIYALYDQCTRRGWCSHAEDFLDFIDTAEKNAMRKSMLEGETGGLAISAIRHYAIWIVANECDFLTFADLEMEAWQPYTRWAERVRPGDTVVTFNYDLVPETLGIDVPLPHDALAYKRKVLKLHGNLTWREAGKNVARLDLGLIRGSGWTPFIATPGPTKRAHRNGLLVPLWNAAVAAIEDANVIVFLGYRFPPSDSEARHVLLKAIKGIRKDRYVRIHTVLGPHTQHEHTVRLTSLLKHTLEDGGRTQASDDLQLSGRPETFHVVAHPLYVEDFLSVFHDRMLHGFVPTELDPTATAGHTKG
jgi:hypothetical protein